MQRIVGFFREWYDVPGGMTVLIPFAVTIALVVLGCAGDLSIRFIRFIF